MNISRINRINKLLKLWVIPILLCIFVGLSIFNTYRIVSGLINKENHSVLSNSNVINSVSDSSNGLISNDEKSSHDQDRNSIGKIKEVDNDLKHTLDEISSSYGATGVQVAIIKNGVVYECYNYGSADKSKGLPVTTETVFRSASLSKLIDALAVMKLSEEGIIDIDNDIGDYLGYRVRNKKYSNIAITPRMLMSHTSSIIDSHNFLSSRNNNSSTPLNKLLSQATSYSGNRPGNKHNYSNFGIAVLTAAVEKKTGIPFYEYTEKQLFQPLGIKGSFLASRINDSTSIANLYNTSGNVSYSVKRQLREKCQNELGQTHHIYQGNITISAADYAKMLCVLLNNGTGENGEQILSSESVNEILKIQYQSGTTSCCLCNYISDSIIKGRTMHYHTGSNFGMYSSFAFDTSDLSGVVVLTSGANAKKEKSGIYNICGDIIRTVYERQSQGYYPYSTSM